jgi:hypothetical protein
MSVSLKQQIGSGILRPRTFVTHFHATRFLGRLEALILKHVAGDFFALDAGDDGDA